jgi:hypothetical protein
VICLQIFAHFQNKVLKVFQFFICFLSR